MSVVNIHYQMNNTMRNNTHDSRIAKQLESGLGGTQYTGNHGTRMDTHSQLKITGTGADGNFQSLSQMDKGYHGLVGKDTHQQAVVALRLRYASHSDVAIANLCSIKETKARL